ncbi:MAG TPA: hypothetical protein VFJ82_15105 [Longimicrobium sp.]|nr:hypothetical protein [Longimicrobium sp.]
MSKQAQRGILSRFTLLSGAALLASLAACSGDLSSPAARAPEARPANLLASGGRLVSNAVKYHDSSAPHATGRSGSARLEGEAELGADGVTRLTITTGSLDDPGHAPGQIVKAQIKVFDPDGELLYVVNYNKLSGSGTQTFLLRGLSRQSRVQVQANVRGIDRSRTDVVTLTAGVVLAPALHVDIETPPTGQVGQPVVIIGVVSETNGDQGSRATCELWVNGQLVDTAAGIWVDAGDAVTCAFTWTPDRPGDQQVEVRVSTDGGGSMDHTIIGSGGTISVGSGLTTGWAAQVEDRSVATASVLEYTWWKPDGSHKEYSDTRTNTERSQTIAAQGTISRAAVFPLAGVQWTIETNGSRWQDESWIGVVATTDAQGRQCVSRDIAEQGALFFLCNGLQGGATWGYQRFAGNVTYHSQGYSNQFDGLTGQQSVYTWNDGYTTYAGGGQVKDLGSQVRMQLTVTDAAGSVVLTPVVPLTSFSGNLSATAPDCVVTTSYELAGGSQTMCTSGRVDESGWRGSAGG